MGFWHMIKLFSECYKLAGVVGLIACGKYVSGSLILPDLDAISSDLAGVSDE